MFSMVVLLFHKRRSASGHRFFDGEKQTDTSRPDSIKVRKRLNL